MTRVIFRYRNHRGEVADREVEVLALQYDPLPHPEYGHQPGWFLHGRDYTGGREGLARSFALTNIMVPEDTFLQPSLNRPYWIAL